jgi:hypothetical protein
MPETKTDSLEETARGDAWRFGVVGGLLLLICVALALLWGVERRQRIRLEGEILRLRAQQRDMVSHIDSMFTGSPSTSVPAPATPGASRGQPTPETPEP